MDFSQPTVLGRTGLKVGRLGISSSFGAPAKAFEEAFEKGCNYFTWGTFIKGRAHAMRDAIRNIIAKGKRSELVIALLTYSHSGFLTERFYHSALKALGTDYLDVLLLGYYPSMPSRGVMDNAFSLKQRGLTRFIGVTGHNRKAFPEFRKSGLFDLFHLRYNAAHRGAETEIFPFIGGADRPGVVSFTATDWRKLLNPKKMPAGQQPPSAMDCYRFVLSNPAVDICMTGTKDLEQMRQNLGVLQMGPMSDGEMARMRAIGDHVYGRKTPG
jgi:aryl-alcohol dehydrogenase-like predicted oxidoreductase